MAYRILKRQWRILFSASPLKNTQNKKKNIQIALKLSKLWGFMFYKMASERDPLEKRHRPTENQ